MKVELYKHTPANVRYWSAEADYSMGCIVIRHGVLGGVLQEQIEYVDENQSGRSLEDQIDLYLEARASKKKDIGYRYTIEESKGSAGNTMLGHHRPMLAKRFDQLNDVDFNNCYVQMKYDGHRCMVTRTSTGLVAYSRNGRIIKTIDHILEGIRIPMGCTIDGELYIHGSNLQTISSYVKRKQPGTMNLEYVIYDIVLNSPYNVRYNLLQDMSLNRYARIAPTDKSIDKSHLTPLLETAIANGYEGLMLRQCRYPYEPGKRSKALVKVKEFLDAEYRVVGIATSADGWAVLTCKTSDGKEFGVSAPGSIREKIHVARNHDLYLGRLINVKYANLTEDGIPFHPVAVRWHDPL